MQNKQSITTKFSLLLISFALSNITFYLIDDPEGANLLISLVLTAIIYASITLIIYFINKLSRQG